MKFSPSISHSLHSIKSTVKIATIFVAFLENMNFRYVIKQGQIYVHVVIEWPKQMGKAKLSGKTRLDLFSANVIRLSVAAVRLFSQGLLKWLKKGHTEN